MESRSNPLRTNPLQKPHKLPKSNRKLDIPIRIDHSFRKRDASTEQTRDDSSVFQESTRFVIELDGVI